MKAFEFVKRNAVALATLIVGILIVTNVVLIIYNNGIIDRASKSQIKNEKMKVLFSKLWSDGVTNIDLGLRGYVIIKDDQMLIPYQNGIKNYKVWMDELRKDLQDDSPENLQSLDTIKTAYDGYYEFSKHLLALIKIDSIDQFKEELKKDKGYHLWMVYDRNSNKILKSYERLNEEAMSQSQTANQRIVILQVLLGIVGLPTLFFTLLLIKKERRRRELIFKKLDQNNKDYLFNPGNETSLDDEDKLIEQSITNLKTAATFVSQISKGNFVVEWEGLTPDNQDLNKNNLTGELLEMRERMKQFKAQDDRRIWTADGLAKISEIIRNHQDDLKELGDEVITFLVKYLNLQQGGLFIVKGDEESEKYLELLSCYAFSRKKFLTKKIAIGEGLIGQTYLEQQPVLLTELPENYTTIKSGLGERTPECLSIVPMKYNEKVEAIIEIAGFEKLESFHIEFLEKVGDIVAATLGTMQINEKTKALLEDFKSQAEQLRAQEEELRQNMEEMAATQEAMKRESMGV